MLYSKGMDVYTCRKGVIVKMNLQSMKRASVPLHAEVAELLRRQILSGDLVAGSKLPSLKVLTEQLGVARMTIIQAMNALEDEGLIEKHSGKGTFVKAVVVPERHTLQMRANISQIYAMVEELEVSVTRNETVIDKTSQGQYVRAMTRIHARSGQPFCLVDIKLDDQIYELAPERFSKEIVVSVLRDLGVNVDKARQKVTIAYADFALAQSLGIKVNSAVFKVFREFLARDGTLIYSATLLYPGDLLELEIEFATDSV